MVIIRDASYEDARSLLDIYDYYVQKTAISFEIKSPGINVFTDRMADIMRSYPYLVAEYDGRIAGYAYARPFVGREAYSHSCETTIYVDHELKGKGIGRKLYDDLEKRLKDMGITNLYACIGYTDNEDIYLTNDSARFHEHMGYKKAGTFRKCGRKFGRWYDMIWMEKLLQPHRDDAGEIIPYKSKRYQDIT